MIDSARTIDRYYVDPIDGIWLRVAERLGLQIKRTSDVFASADGQGTLLIGCADTLDADDCLAQMIVHELCHGLVQGAGSAAKPDWGLDNTTRRDECAEHACLRLQATLLDAHGLRAALAPTTEYRAYYDSLPDNPLAGGDDPAIRLATAAWQRMQKGAWREPLREGLEATRQIFEIARRAEAAEPQRPSEPLWAFLRPPDRASD